MGVIVLKGALPLFLPYPMLTIVLLFSTPPHNNGLTIHLPLSGSSRTVGVGMVP